MSDKFLRLLGILTTITLASCALPAEPEPAGSHAAPSSTIEAAPAALTGAQVYNEVCIACHYPPGLGGAPGLGDKSAWAPRLEQGMDTVVGHALNGYSGPKGSIMPKKGGRLDLSDEEIIGAVRYMVEQVAD